MYKSSLTQTDLRIR